jgi:hypothetical protein
MSDSAVWQSMIPILMAGENGEGYPQRLGKPLNSAG